MIAGTLWRDVRHQNSLRMECVAVALYEQVGPAVGEIHQSH